MTSAPPATRSRTRCATPWGRHPEPFERFVARTARPGFDPDLWLLAVDGDQVAGLALGAILSEGGWIAPVGGGRAWRRRGIALALLHQLFAEFYRCGVTRVGLSVDAESPTGATRLYERAGMHVTDRHVRLEKGIRPGRDLTQAAD